MDRKLIFLILLASMAHGQIVQQVIGTVPFPVSTGPIAFVNAAGCSSGGADCNTTISVTAGNTLIALCTTTTLAATQTISDGTNTYTAAISAFTNAGSTTKMLIWTAPVNATNAALVVDMHVSSTTNAVSGVVMQFSGIVASPVDKTANASYAATTAATTGTTATTAQSNEVLVGFFGATPSSGGGGWTPGSGYTHPSGCGQIGIGMDSECEYDIVSATGTYTATATATNSSTGGGVIVTLKGN